MLNTVLKAINEEMESTETFQQMYDAYVIKIQDMDLENEILPLIKRETTDYVKFVKKLERSRKKAMKKVTFDFQL